MFKLPLPWIPLSRPSGPPCTQKVLTSRRIGPPASDLGT